VVYTAERVGGRETDRKKRKGKRERGDSECKLLVLVTLA